MAIEQEPTAFDDEAFPQVVLHNSSRPCSSGAGSAQCVPNGVGTDSFLPTSTIT